MEGGNATDGAGGTDETGQGELMRESSPTSPTKTARSAKESNLHFGLERGHVELLTVARPERLSPTEAIKVARPGLSQDNFDLDTGDPDQASPATVVMSLGSQAQVVRWRAQGLLPKIVPPGHEPEFGQRRMVPPTTEIVPISGHETPIVKAAMPSVPEETMMLCPQEIAPVRYETGEGQATTSLMSLGQVASSSNGPHHGFPSRKEVFTDTVMGENLEDEGDDFQTMLEDGVPNHRQSPLPFRGLDAYDIETSYSSEDETEVFANEDTFGTAFFEPQMQSDNGAQAQHEAQANEQRPCTEVEEARVQAHEMAQASIQEILADNGGGRAQAQPDHAEVPAPLAEREQPILTQQKVMDLIMQHQALPNNTSEGLAATTWATKKQGFTDMLSGFRSPTGTTYRVALDLASVLFVSVAAADANRRSLMAQSEMQQKLVEQH
jgi:hypothetical protein